MDLTVHTGTTEQVEGLHLASRQWSLHGETFCFLLQCTGDRDACEVAEHEVENTIRQSLLESEGEAAARLDSCLKELNGLLKGLLMGSSTVTGVHMVLAVVDEHNVLHLSQAGRAEGYLIRRGILSQITEHVSTPTPAFVHISSGDLVAGDTVVLSTLRLLRLLTPTQLTRASKQAPDLLTHLLGVLTAEQESAAIALVQTPPPVEEVVMRTEHVRRVAEPPRRTGAKQIPPFLLHLWGFLRSARLPSRTSRPSSRSATAATATFFAKTWDALRPLFQRLSKQLSKGTDVLLQKSNGVVRKVLVDLEHPARRKRMHLLLIASAIAILIVVWASVQLLTVSQRSKTRLELETLLEQAEGELKDAENRFMMGGNEALEAASGLLDRAESEVKEVQGNDSGLFQVQASDLLSRILATREKILGIVHVPPRVVASLSARRDNINAQGLVLLKEGDLIAYDPRDAFRALLSSVESPQRITDDALIKDAAVFQRFETVAFLTTSGNVVECDWMNCQPVPMKTDDPRGWMSGTAIDAYLRYLYILSPEKNQIYKYERLTSRYGPPTEYNVSGELRTAVDFTIDNNVYVLRSDGTIVRLFRGEQRDFSILNAPTDALKGTTRIVKAPGRSFFLLDPVQKRIVVLSDVSAEGKSTYLRQYIIDIPDIGELKDIAVDANEGRLYILDASRIYAIDLGAVLPTPTASSSSLSISSAASSNE